MKEKRLSSIYVVLAASMWGTIGVSVRILSQFHFSSIQVVVARLLMAVIFLGGFLLVTDKDKLKIEQKDIKWFLGTGILSMLFLILVIVLLYNSLHYPLQQFFYILHRFL